MWICQTRGSMTELYELLLHLLVVLGLYLKNNKLQKQVIIQYKHQIY